MSVLESEAALQALETLNTAPPEDVVLTFNEPAGMLTAKWAVRRFGSQYLVDQSMRDFNDNPYLDEDGKKIDIDDMSDHQRTALLYRQEIAHDDAQDLGHDLDSAYRKVKRGYKLGQVAFHGAYDAATIIGSLEQASRINPENLDSGELHHQAAAKFMLDHLRVQDGGSEDAQSYLI